MAKPDAAGNPNSIDYKWQIRAKTHMVTSGDLLARIADLEAAARLLGAEVWASRLPSGYEHLGWNRRIFMKKAKENTDSHPTAAGFVKEATDGH